MIRNTSMSRIRIIVLIFIWPVMIRRRSLRPGPLLLLPPQRPLFTLVLEKFPLFPLLINLLPLLVCPLHTERCQSDTQCIHGIRLDPRLPRFFRGNLSSLQLLHTLLASLHPSVHAVRGVDGRNTSQTRGQEHVALHLLAFLHFIRTVTQVRITSGVTSTAAPVVGGLGACAFPVPATRCLGVWVLSLRGTID